MYVFVECRDKLDQILKLIAIGMMKVPVIRYGYTVLLPRSKYLPLTSQSKEPCTDTKFSIVRSVICAHLLHSSPKLRELYAAYDADGLSIISQIGVCARCDCQMQLQL